jgi:hypothetical protein
VTDAPGPARSGDDRKAASTPAPRERKLQFNPQALKIVDARKRKFWEQLAHEVEIDVAEQFRKKWTLAATARVILADPAETYEEVATELGRSPGAVRYRRMAMVHLLRDEHGAPERVQAYIADPKANHKFHDYYQVHQVLLNLGYYELPVSEQFRLAQPLRQPKASWRGDGTAAALALPGNTKILRDEVKRLIQEARERSKGS